MFNQKLHNSEVDEIASSIQTANIWEICSPTTLGGLVINIAALIVSSNQHCALQTVENPRQQALKGTVSAHQ